MIPLLYEATDVLSAPAPPEVTQVVNHLEAGVLGRLEMEGDRNIDFSLRIDAEEPIKTGARRITIRSFF